MTPKAAGFHIPAEWDRHDSVWLAWPSAADLWEENLAPAQAEFIALCEAIAKSEKLNVLVPDTKSGADAERRLGHLRPTIHLLPFGDIWLRDTAPVFMRNAKGELATVRFAFNGWGGKYELDHDPQVAERVAKAAGVREFTVPFVLEGGSVELDGEGTCLTSRQCLLNENRNEGWTQDRVERELCESLGVEKVLWLGDGLINDHTDGHIDTIARFSAPGVVLCMEATDDADPNREIMATIRRDLEAMTDARGRKLTVHTVPSPGAVLNEDGDVMPASYLNFYISNDSVIVPTYGMANDDAAVKAIAQCFPARKTFGLSARAILSGGGAFHCISQQQPAR